MRTAALAICLLLFTVACGGAADSDPADTPETVTEKVVVLEVTGMT